MDHFSQATRRWLADAFDGPTAIQRLGWPPIAAGRHALLIAPTGSGKTLAAFLAGIDRLSRLPLDAAPGVRLLYVSPLKALVYDVERNLRAPLAGIQRAAERLGEPLRPVQVDVRTGDTPQRERQRQVRHPGEILVTTPESLFLLLGSQARETLRQVETVIVDEIHALAPTKRGAHLALSLERLEELCASPPQRVGLSATVRPRDAIARFLGGRRPVAVVDAEAKPRLDLQVTVPVADMENVRPPAPSPRGGSILAQLYTPQVHTSTERGIWPAVYPALLEQILAHRSTIVFVNNRGLCERLAQRLNELADSELVRAHHGSLSHPKRAEIEDALKRGVLRGIVATSSLELGIDMGAVDQVLLVESPGSVARGLQRVGRAGHQAGAVSRGRIFPKFRGDLLECAVIAGRMLQGEIEALAVPRNPLDVLAQQVVAMVADQPMSPEAIGQVVRRAHPYQDLSEDLLHGVLDMLAGHYPSTEFADLHPWLSWDRAADVLHARRGAALTTRMNAGTIPDRGNYGVFLPDGPRVGELDEEMVYESRTGDTILLGASTWRIEEITRDRVIVSPAPGEPGRLPFWHGEGPGRPVELGRALGAFTRHLGSLAPDEAVAWLRRETVLDDYAARNLAAYVAGQKAHTGSLPTDRTITIERFRDELGDWRVCILTPFGARLHAPWALALQRALSAGAGFEVQIMYTDDGIVLRLADTEETPTGEDLIPDPETVEDLVTEQLADSALFAGLFRENAGRSLLIPRRRPDQRNPLWSQRLKAQQLLAAVKRYPAFPIVLETYRQALADVFDLAGLKQLLGQIRQRQVRVVDVETPSASPFARSLVFAYVAAYIYEQDQPLAERKAQALTLDRGLLSELLGQAELRELLDPQVMAELEQQLQHLLPERQAQDADQLHDLLRRLGDLDEDELRQRSAADPANWLAQLAAAQRAVEVSWGGRRRWIAAEDAGLYRDALGAMPPPGLPADFLAITEQPLEQLLRRYARGHGPFVTAQAAARFALLPAQVEPVLRALEAQSHLVRGELRPGGAELDWCDPEVLRRLKRLTLARLRHQIAPVEAAALARFLVQWQGLADGPTLTLEEALIQLEGLPLSWSLLSRVLLPARVAGFRPEALDLMAAGGGFVWVGRGPLGSRDGRIAIFRRQRAARLLTVEAFEPPSPLHQAILDHLQQRGAVFLFELEGAVNEALPGAAREDVRAALWDLVWAGQISNDTFAPLRALGGKTSGRRGIDPLAGGRWSLVSQLAEPQITATERSLAWAETLLERYGLVSRESAQAEGLAWGPLYQVLKAMEEAGRIRRGYFVEGLSGAQFGHVGAVDRLRGARGAAVTGLAVAAADPANPFGALLPWPASGDPQAPSPRRVPGAWVILVGGRPALYLASGGRRLMTFPETLAAAETAMTTALAALGRLPRQGRRGLLTLETIDGVPVSESPWQEALREAGFHSDYRGLTLIPEP